MRKPWGCLPLLLVTCTPVPLTSPSLFAVSPSSVVVGSAPSIVVTGQDFKPGIFTSYARPSHSAIDARFALTLGDKEVSDVTYVANDTLTGTAPALAPGVYDLNLTAPDGSTATLPAAFTVTAATATTGVTGGTNGVDPCAGVTSPACTLVGWKFRKRISFNFIQSDVVDDLTVLVALDSSRIDYSRLRADGGDLRFVDSDETTVLPYEIEQWDPSGRSTAWVRVPQLAANAGDHMWMVYGNATATSAQGGAWDNGFDGVWHLQSLSDSTARISSNLLGGATATTGKIAGALSFSTLGDGMFIGSSLPILTAASAVTLSAWVQLTAYPMSGETLIFAASVASTSATSTSRVSLGVLPDGKIRLSGRTSDSDMPSYEAVSTLPLPTGSWQYISTTQNLASNRLEHFLNGVPTNNNWGASTFASQSFPSTPPHNASIGSEDTPNDGGTWLGKLDEVRIARSPRTSAWIFADYKSVNDQLCTYGNEQPRN